MKTSQDPRHVRRQEIIKLLFAESFTPQKIADPKAREVLEKLPVIDEKIQEIAPEFPIDKINKVDLAILRLGAYELMFEKKEPAKVVIDEAIELAKEFGGENSPGFINGALGKLVNTSEKSTEAV